MAGYDKMAKRAPLPQKPKEYVTVKIDWLEASSWWTIGKEVVMGCLGWGHEFSLAGEGETFRRAWCPCDKACNSASARQKDMRLRELRSVFWRTSRLRL